MARLKPKDRKKQILDAALINAETFGFSALTRESVARGAEVAPALINRYFGTMNRLKFAVMKYAIKNEVLPIVADGVGTRNPQAIKISKELKIKVSKWLYG